MECFGYETFEKLLCTSREDSINTNTISKKGIPKITMNVTYPSLTICFGCYPHTDTCDVLSENLGSHRLQAYSSIYEGGIMSYINKVKSRHGIGIPTTCGYPHGGEKYVLMLEICLLNLIFH